MRKAQPSCKDCIAEGITTKRKAPYPGPRCSSHHRAVRSKRRNVTWEDHIMKTYGITTEQYWKLYAHQGGVCNICQRAKGTGRRKLAVDHDHKTGEVRQLLCLRCNRNVLGHLRDDVDALRRAADSVENPPAREVIGPCFVPSTDATENQNTRVKGGARRTTTGGGGRGIRRKSGVTGSKTPTSSATGRSTPGMSIFGVRRPTIRAFGAGMRRKSGRMTAQTPPRSTS